MKHAIIFILALSVTIRLVAAQDTFPPDPSEIFTDAVEVISVETVDTQASMQPSHDDELRVIRAYDAQNQTQREYPYPDTMNDVWRIIVRSDGTLLVLLKHGDLEDVYNADEYWLLNPVTGEFSRPEIVCDNQAQALIGEGEWRIVTNSEDQKDVLCFTETGELLDILPQELVWVTESHYGWRNTPVLSPSGEWLVVVGYEENQTHGDFVNLYGYQLSGGVFNNLGQIGIPVGSSIDNFYFDCPLSNTICVASVSSSFDYLSNDYYVFDAAQADSVEFAHSGWGYRYLQTNWFVQSTTGSMTREHLNCVFHLIDERGARSYDLGYDCEMRTRGDIYETCDSLHENGDAYYFLRFNGNPSTISTVMKLDVTTDEMTEVLSGEFESLLSVSPDGRYLALAVDPNGQIDRVDRGCDWQNWDALAQVRLTIFDTLENRFIYQTETLGGRGAQVNWQADDAVILFLDEALRWTVFNEVGDMIPNHVPASIRLIIPAGVYTVYDTPNQHFDNFVSGVSMDYRQTIVNHETLINFSTLTSTPIFREGHPFFNAAQFIWNDDGTIQATLTMYQGTFIYTIRVTPQESP